MWAHARWLTRTDEGEYFVPTGARTGTPESYLHARCVVAIVCAGRYGKGASRVLVSYFLDMMSAGESPSLSAMSREVLAQLRQPPQHAQRVTRVIARRATPAAQPKVRGYPPQLCEVVTKYSLENKSFEDVMRHVNAELK